VEDRTPVWAFSPFPQEFTCALMPSPNLALASGLDSNDLGPLGSSVLHQLLLALGVAPWKSQLA
jgi:hypothetical protein